MNEFNEEIEITTRDKLLRAWQNSMELTRDFEVYSKDIKDNPEIANLFNEFAIEEGLHASKLRELLHNYNNQY